MAPTKTVAALLAVLVVATGAAAAMPGNAPADAGAQADDQTDAANQHDAAAGTNANANATAATGPAADDRAAAQRGPPVDMPDPVPDFVSDIHQTIQNYLNGSIDDLGAALGDVTPGGESTDTTGDDDAVDDAHDEGDDATDSAPDEGDDTSSPQPPATPA
jgi:hypothetical protein